MHMLPGTSWVSSPVDVATNKLVVSIRGPQAKLLPVLGLVACSLRYDAMICLLLGLTFTGVVYNTLVWWCHE